MLQFSETSGKFASRFDKFTKDVNAEFEKHKLPLRLRNFANTFSLNFLNNSLYNSMFCQYLISNEAPESSQSLFKFAGTQKATTPFC